jgi:hypothetical protein
MSIINRRNAVLGWGVWKIGKRRAKQAAPLPSHPNRRRRIALALAGGIAVLAGGLVALRRVRAA